MSSEVLLISRDPGYGRVLSEMLSSISISIDQVSGLNEARRKLESTVYSVVLTEANLPDGTWVDVLEFVGGRNSKVIVTHPHADARLWVEVLNRGAHDFLAQPFATAEVQRIFGNACADRIRAPQRMRAG